MKVSELIKLNNDMWICCVLRPLTNLAQARELGEHTFFLAYFDIL